MTIKNKKNSGSVYKISPIFLTLISFVIVLNSCSVYTYKHKPYYLNQASVLFEDSNGNLYFKTGTGTVSLCKYCFEEKGHRRVCRFNDGDEQYNFEMATSNSNYLFVYLTPVDIELFPTIKVFNKSFEEVNKIYFSNNDQIIGLASSNQYVYIYKKESKTNSYSLVKYDYLSNSTSVLIDDLSGFTSYQDEDISLFFPEYNDHKYFGKYDEKTTLINDYSNHLFTDKLFLKLSNDSITISNSGVEHSFKKEHIFNSFYEKAFLFGNDLYFATYSYSKSPECGQEADAFQKCFCGVKESYLFHFDTSTNELSEINSFKTGTYLIDYDLSSTKYYYDGALYIDGEMIKECEKIQADSLVKIDAFEKMKDYKLNYYLSYYNNNFQGI